MPRRTVTPEEAFGNVVRQLRLELDMSQEELAHAADRHRTYVSLIERGMNSPSLQTIFRLAKVLGVKPSELLSRVEKQKR